MITFKKGSAKDIGDAIRIGKMLPELFTTEAFKKMRNDFDDHELYVAMKHDQMVGFCSITVKNKCVAEITWLGVNPDEHRKGIGEQLIGFVSRELNTNGRKLLEVKTLDQSCDYEPYERTRLFYEKCGFLHVDSIDPYPGWEVGNPCAIYIKILNDLF
ncbi:GNAT family N-acetyltransferase [Haloplasma contractile]|uniref:Phospholipiddiacylglycerol acyltransferase protein n=1 Tax=Haloplasma contractile SSD-17B TaxID=1033810 RepID=U2EAL9_9MOLU|nr:GNAT family N-acetyltransferase [Haloplasma contractile]ERJ12148.1 phospholipiddiacylglycerol acyltransferase protein [Haloplasma contractile SSD-17B]